LCSHCLSQRNDPKENLQIKNYHSPFLVFN
jgi:hypothetical protein